jgi:hypothetical protein
MLMISGRYSQSKRSPRMRMIVAMPVGSRNSGASVNALSAPGQTGQINMHTACGAPAPDHASLIASICLNPEGAPRRRFARPRQSIWINGNPSTQTRTAKAKVWSGSAGTGTKGVYVEDLEVAAPRLAVASIQSVIASPPSPPRTGMASGSVPAPRMVAKDVATTDPAARPWTASAIFLKSDIIISLT